MSNENPTIENLITEKDLAELFGISKNALDQLRYDGLPYLKVNTRSRLYLESDIMAWLLSRKMVLNQGETNTE